MFNYNSNQSYEVNTRKIIEYSCHLSEKSLGILYQNLVNHFQKIVEFYNVPEREKLVEHLPIVQCNIVSKV